MGEFEIEMVKKQSLLMIGSGRFIIAHHCITATYCEMRGNRVKLRMAILLLVIRRSGRLKSKRSSCTGNVPVDSGTTNSIVSSIPAGTNPKTSAPKSSSVPFAISCILASARMFSPIASVVSYK